MFRDFKNFVAGGYFVGSLFVIICISVAYNKLSDENAKLSETVGKLSAEKEEVSK